MNSFSETSQVPCLQGSRHPANLANTEHDSEPAVSEGNDYNKAQEQAQEQNTKSTSETKRYVAGINGSLTWVSEETRERDCFRKMRSNIGFIAPNSPVVPRNMKEWLEYRVVILGGQIRGIYRSIAAKEVQNLSSSTVQVQPVLAGKELGDFRSTVLARETIWRPDEVDNPSRQQAPWPESSERKHEGYQRVRSGYSRFPPLPRVPGNPTVNWKQRSPITPHEFDQFGRPVAIQEVDIEIPREMELAIGESLLQELDR